MPWSLEVQVGRKTAVYVDESGFPTSNLRRYAYAPKGICVRDKISGSYRYESTSLMVSARIGDNFTAPVLFQGASDALAFNAWLEHQLCPLLDETHVVIMDNASFHKGAETETRLIAATGASLLFLPPYSPELNPIKKDFANIKRRYQYNPETSIEQIIKVYN